MAIELPQVTLVSVSSIQIEETIMALIKSSEEINFHDCILLSDELPDNLPEKISFHRINKLTNVNEYSRFCLFELTKYIKTEYALIIQYDGYVLRPSKWQDTFLNYDYIGAPWPSGLFDGSHLRVGNGGFSLRSKKLLDSMTVLNLPFTDNGTGHYSEDLQICVFHRTALENSGIKFAPPKLAAEFSHELEVPEHCNQPFGFHRYII